MLSWHCKQSYATEEMEAATIMRAAPVIRILAVLVLLTFVWATHKQSC